MTLEKLFWEKKLWLKEAKEQTGFREAETECPTDNQITSIAETYTFEVPGFHIYELLPARIELWSYRDVPDIKDPHAKKKGTIRVLKMEQSREFLFRYKTRGCFQLESVAHRGT